ncbi:F-box domain-containing protein [[Candida] zeylanoides]
MPLYEDFSRLSQFNVPVGYVKNPLGPARAVRTRTPAVVPPPPHGLTLESLPHEIRAKVASALGQLDCLALSRVSRRMHASTVPRLYHNVKVDYNFSHFSKEYDGACSYIKTAYSLKKFLASGKRLRAVWSFSCIELPPLNVHDHEFQRLLTAFFSALHCLRHLVWLDAGFEYRYLKVLPNCASIVSLSLNLKHGSFVADLNRDRHRLVLPQLTAFSVDSCQSTLALRDLSVLYSAACSLQCLQLSRSDHHLNDAQLLYPCQALADGNIRYNPSERNTISAILRADTHFDNLTTLSLNDFLIEPEEATLLMHSVDLAKLTTLELCSISEIQQSSPTHLTKSFLLRIVGGLSSLQHLLIDYRESITDSVPRFLQALPTARLESLDLTIRFNRSKLITFADEAALYEAYSQALSMRDFQTIKKLSLDIKDENSYCADINLSLPLPASFFPFIKSCRELQSLRLSPGDGEVRRVVLELVARIAKLQYLDVFGTKAGGAPHLGLEMVHPTLYDEWFKVQHVAMIYAQCNRCLKYIRVNKCIFENTGTEVSPRDGINRWFNQRVKMGIT